LALPCPPQGLTSTLSRFFIAVPRKKSFSSPPRLRSVPPYLP
jgi:hypothetical protein